MNSGQGSPPADRTSLFRIRNARRGDSEAIRALISELGYVEACDSQTVAWVISHPEMEVFIGADHLDWPIALLALSHRPQLRLGGRIATVDELVVTRAWQRKGVGRALVQRASERAKVLGAKRVELISHLPQETMAKAFYESNGFTQVDVGVFRMELRDAVRRNP